MVLRACGTCGLHRTRNLHTLADEQTLIELWRDVGTAKEPYTPPTDRRIPDLWLCSDCGAYTWDEIGDRSALAGRFTWRPGTDGVVRLSDLEVANDGDAI